MRRLRVATSPVRPRQRLTPITNHQIPQHPPEDLECSNGLVVRNLVPRLVDAQEAKVAILAHLAVLGAVNDEGFVACSSEFVGVRVVDSEGDGFAAEPLWEGTF